MSTAAMPDRVPEGPGDAGPTHLWVVGSSGLLGSALTRVHDTDRLFRSTPVPWTDPDAAVAVLVADLDAFAATTGAQQDWAILWAAGAGVIGSDAETFQRETSVLTRFVEALRDRRPAGAGAFFLSSSAAVYGGSTGAPFSESTTPVPLNLYAQTKHAQEAAVSAALTGTLPHVVGRISTLFGPGQDLSKGQGLISTMCLQAATRRPVRLFVPIDTLRDYVYVDDAARVIGRFVATARRTGDTATRVRVVARGTSVTIAQLAAVVRVVGHRRIGISQAGLASSSAHVGDLRVRTDFGDELRGVPWTPLPAGIDAVFADVMRGLTRPAGAH